MRRHSTAGSSPSFPFLNIIGFLSYLVSNTLLFYAPAIRAQYAARHGGKTPTVRGNDVVFAAHALAMSLLVASMFWGGRACWGIQGPRGRVEGWVRGVGIGCLVGVGTVAGAVQARGTGSPTGWAGIDVVSVLLRDRVGG
jgi:cystinosin